MTLLNNFNIGGTGYGIQNNLPMGTCATPAGTEVKTTAFADNFELSAGNMISVTFTYANTYGDGSTTYPKIVVNGAQYPIKYPEGGYAASGAWNNGQIVTFMFDGTNLIMTNVPKIQTTSQVTEGNQLPVTSDGVAAELATRAVPTGAILPYGGSSAPDGFLVCDGSAISRTDYAALFSVIGTAFGAGDNSTTFNVPDMRESVPVGAGSSSNTSIHIHDTYTVGQFKDDVLGQHYHPLRNGSGVQVGTGGYYDTMTDVQAGQTSSVTHGKRTGVTYIIKY